MDNPKDIISKVFCSPVIEPTEEQAKEILKNCGILDENYNIAEEYMDIFIRKVDKMPRCHKCVYETQCSKDKDNEHKCPKYKRDAPDGGYYG